MKNNLLEAERGTRYFFGKPYHWNRDESGVLYLLAGSAPTEESV